MKAERVILSFIALIVGLAVAGLAFYFYQMTKTIPETKVESQTRINPSPTPNEKENFLVVENPKDDEVVDSKTITISGKVNKDATIIITTESAEDVVTPSANGDFSLTQVIGEGTNLIQITAILPDGREKRVLKTVTYSTENF